MSTVRRAALALTLTVTGSSGLLAQGKPPKPVSTVAATATFRCDALADPDAPDACLLQADDSVTPGVDHLRDDGTVGYEGTLGESTFYYRSTSPRTMRLYLREFLPGSRECVGALAGCNPTLPAGVAFDGRRTVLDDFELRVKPLVPGTFEDLPGGLVQMACGEANAGPALVHLTVWMPDVEGHWGLNYNPRAYHSTAALIVRTGTYTWTVEAAPTADPTIGQVAELVAFNHSGIRRKAGPSHEGLFEVPFKLTIDSAGRLPAASTTCP